MNNMNPLERKISKAINRLNIAAPFYGAIVMNTRIRILEPGTTEYKKYPVMATNGKEIIINPRFIIDSGVSDIAAVLAHESAHICHAHHIRRGNRNPLLFNIASDYAINQEIATNPRLTLPENRLLDSRFSGLSAELIYRALIQIAESGQSDSLANESQIILIQSGYGNPGESESESDSDSESENESDSDSESESENESESDSDSESDSESESENESESDSDSESDSESENESDSESESENESDSDSDSESDSESESGDSEYSESESGGGNSDNGDNDSESESDNGSGGNSDSESDSGKDSDSESVSQNYGGCGSVIDSPDLGSKSESELIAELAINIAAAGISAGASGESGARGLSESILNELKSGRLVNWKNILKAEISNKGIKEKSDWNRKNRRAAAIGIYIPDSIKRGKVFIVVDSSGSISDSKLAEFFSGVKDITRQFTDYEILSHDHAIRGRYTDFKTAAANIKGGGGTAFIPVLEYIRKAPGNSKTVVWFTDSYAADLEYIKIPLYRAIGLKIYWVLTNSNYDNRFEFMIINRGLGKIIPFWNQGEPG